MLLDSPFSLALIMLSSLTSKCAGLLSNIPNKQTALWIADINLSQCREKVLGLGAAESGEERGRVRFHSWNFSFVFTSKNFSALFGATCLPLPHVPHMCLGFVSHTHTQTHIIYTEWFGVWHESLPSVVCAVSEHEPLSACWRCSST